VTDIPSIPTRQGWRYRAGVKDVHPCEIVGDAMGARMTQELTGQALIRAVKHQGPAPGLIHHANRGRQSCASGDQAVLKPFRMPPSMSRRGHGYDNAPMESFWGTLKDEWVHHRRDTTRAEAKADMTEYIEIFYNRQRRHSKLGHLSPAVFAQPARIQPMGA
jgi:putative transposase